MKTRLVELQERRVSLLDESTRILEKPQETRTTADADRVKAILSEVDDIDKKIDIEVQHRTLVMRGEELVGKGIPLPDTSGLEDRNGGPGGPGGGAVRGRASYRSLFCERGATLDTGGFQSFRDFMAVVHSGRFDPRLRGASVDSGEKRAMTEGVPSAGGFAVPVEYGAGLWDTLLENSIVLQGGTKWPMTSKTRKIPAWDGADHSSTVYGGLTWVWNPEDTEITPSDAKLREMTLTARTGALLVPVSNELIEDGYELDGALSTAMATGGAFELDAAFLTGDGAGKPLGILNDNALITVAKEGGQANSTITYPNLVKMFARVHPACIGRSAWLANPTTIPQLLQLTVAVGTGGSHIPVVTESNGEFRILTRPVHFTEKLPALGSAGDIALADLSQYAIGARKELAVEKSAHVGFTRNRTYYRLIVRVDGQGTWSEAVTPRNGDSLSWCVTLAARSA